MKARIAAVLFLCVFLCGFSRPQVQGEVVMEETPVAESVDAFGCDLYGELGPGNLFFSPYSIHAALSMTSAGAEGRTLEQMREVLHISGEGAHAGWKAVNESIERSEGVELSVANALWMQENHRFERDFLNVVEDSYDASLFRCDFRRKSGSERRRINSWVEDETGGKIEDLVPEGMLGSMTRLVLTNAIYFRGDWKDAFEKKATRREKFRTGKGGRKVSMMKRTGDYAFARYPGLKVLEMPYEGGELSMVVFLPDEGKGPGSIEMSKANIDKWCSGLAVKEVQVRFPKFRMETGFLLAERLKKMGMVDAFTEDADFSGIDGGRELMITDVVHKAFIEVDEKGTEAAAATGVVMKCTAIAEAPPEFFCDHPFVFLIRHKPSGTVLFAGRLNEP